MPESDTPMTWTCGACGEAHEGPILDIGYLRPVAYFEVAEDEREARCKVSDDLCVIDDAVFLIRGCLPIPLTDHRDDFFFGCWAEVSQRDFREYLDLWDADARDHPPFDGRLSFEPSGYHGLLAHPVAVQLQDAEDRPLFLLTPSDHRLYRQQRDGITLTESQEIVHQVAPYLFMKSVS